MHQMLQTLWEHRKERNVVVIDVGGNIGMYSLAAAATGHEVHVFEPVPLSAAMMLESARRNNFSRFHLYPTCVSDRAGLCRMGRASRANEGSVSHTLLAAAATSTEGAGSSGPQVLLPAMPLDALLTVDERRMYFIKLDIEGSECRALRGMASFLSRAALRSVVGFQMEWHLAGQTCCRELVAPGGAFDTLHTRHGLCPRAASKAQVIGERLAVPSLCSRRPGYALWDLIWEDCSK